MTWFPPTQDGSWNEIQLLQVFTSIIYPGAIFSFIYNGIGTVLFYVFKKNRTFPVVVIGWVALTNTIYSAWLIAKWTPGTVSTEHLLLNPSPQLCFFVLFVDQMYYMSIVVLNTFIAAILYASIVHGLDVDYEFDKKYYWYAVIFYWISTLSVSFGFAGSYANNAKNGYCSAPSATFSILPMGIFLLIQAVLIGLSLARIKVITKRVSGISSNSKRDNRFLLMVVRFVVTVVSQMISVASYFIYLLNSAKLANSPPLAVYIMVIVMICYAMDGTVLIGLNRPLMKWIRRKTSLSIGVFKFSNEDSSNMDMKSSHKPANNSASTLT